jgi:hypothetical protein
VGGGGGGGTPDCVSRDPVLRAVRLWSVCGQSVWLVSLCGWSVCVAGQSVWLVSLAPPVHSDPTDRGRSAQTLGAGGSHSPVVEAEHSNLRV